MTDTHDDTCPECGEDISAVTHGLKNALEKTREERDANKANASKAKDELREAETELASATSKNEALVADNAALTESTTKLQDEATSGKITAAIVKARGNIDILSPMIKAKLAENPDANLDEMIAGMRADENFSGAFASSSNHSGGGSDPQHGNDAAIIKARLTSENLRLSTMTDRQKIDYQKAHGIDALLLLPQ